jgi:hypothetical protein
METVLDEEMPRPRLAVLLQHFSQIDDGQERQGGFCILSRKCCYF